MKKNSNSSKSSGLITIRIVKAVAISALAAFAVSTYAQSVPVTIVPPGSPGGTPATAVGPLGTATPVTAQPGTTQTSAIAAAAAAAATSALPPGTGTPGNATIVAAPATDVRAETAWFLALGQRGYVGPESFVVPVTGAAQIAEVRQYLAERAAGTEKRALIPTVVISLLSDGVNRNYSAQGTPLWPWRVTEVLGFERYTRPEIETANIVISRDAMPSQIENLLRGIVPPPPTWALRDYPIVMELQTGSARGALANLSDRGFVGTGSNVKITGFVVDGGTPRSVVVRVLGPSLAAYGVTGTLANPRFELYHGAQRIAENDDWATGNLNRPYVTVLPGTPPYSLIPNDAREPALELSLPPGDYTIVVSGADGGTGIALTEVHLL